MKLEHPFKIYKNLSSIVRYRNNRRITSSLCAKIFRGEACMIDYAKKLLEESPFLAGKIGGAELMALEFMDHKIKLNWPRGWSWERPVRRLHNNAGFFPIEKKAFLKWHELMADAIASTDFLCNWQTDPFLRLYENKLIESLAPESKSIKHDMLSRLILPTIAPFRWLVVSPFVKTMKKQVIHLKDIHDPEGKNSIDWDYIARTCQFVRCPFQSHLEPSPYASWEDGLEKLTMEVSSKDFDLALIGAGAWSLPLGSRIKKMGGSAIHLGGEMQLFFGIRGKRWANGSIYNSAWANSDPEDTPKNANRVEDGCYW